MEIDKTLEPLVVLIAEDDAMIADLIATIVEFAGATPVVAESSHEAIELAREQCPALLIAEAKMPTLDGAALIAAVRAECGSTLPTILVASVPRSDAQTVIADAVLPKPFPISLLQAHLSRLLPA